MAKRDALERRLLQLEEEVRKLRSRGLVSSPWITLQDVCQSTGLSRWTIWRKVKAGAFPAPCQPFPNVERWAREEVEGWKSKQLKGRRDAQ
jgi:predicted DNA-binding transcriptional regulator AlpA